jgi:cytochrome-b5 reductase
MRTYATEPGSASASSSSSSSGSSSTLLYAAGALGVGGAATYYFWPAGSGAAKVAEAKAKVKDAAARAGVGVGAGEGAKKALTGGEQGFVSLKLAEVQDVNHNTKRFRFKLPEEDMVSGLKVASAILTKVKPEGAEKAVLRPYTPISDEGESGGAPSGRSWLLARGCLYFAGAWVVLLLMRRWQPRQGRRATWS